MRKEEVIEIVDYIFKVEFECRAKLISSPFYYKNIFIKYAMEHHYSLQCIIRTYLELLKAFFERTKKRFDLWEINQWLVFLNTYQNHDKLEYIDAQMKEMNKKLRLADYVIRGFSNRFKSVLSCLAKLRSCEVTEVTLKFIKENFDTFPDFKKFNDEEKTYAVEYLMELWNKNYQKSPIKDLIGYREVFYICDGLPTEIDTEKAVYFFVEYVRAFCQEKGFSIYKEKDYIKEPKSKTGYQSYHILLDFLGTMTELQVRTGTMHEKAEYGEWGHDSIYKNTTIYKFLKKFLYDTSSQMRCISLHKDIGLLSSLSLDDMSNSTIPNIEVPPTPDKLQECPDIDYIFEGMDINYAIMIS